MVEIKSDGHQCHQKQNNKDNNNEREQLNRHRTSEFNKPPSTRDVQSIYNCTRNSRLDGGGGGGGCAGESKPTLAENLAPVVSLSP